MPERNKREREAAREQERRVPEGAGTSGQQTPQVPQAMNFLEMLFGGGGLTPEAFQQLFQISNTTPGIGNLGQLGDVEFGQVDVRTPFMKLLEAASAPTLFGALTNPAGIPGMLGGTPLGQGGSAPGNDLISMLLGGGAGMAMGGGGGPISGQPPADSPNQGNPPTEFNFLKHGGQLEPDAINVVGESGPEAVVGDQVIPLRQQQMMLSGLTNQFPGLTQSISNGQAVLGTQQGGGSFQALDQQPTFTEGGLTGLNMDAINAITGVQPSTPAAPASPPAGGGGGQTAQTPSAGGIEPAPDLGGGGNQPNQAPVGGQQTQFSSQNQQGSGGMIQRLLEQNPEQQAFGVASDFLTGDQGLLGQDPGAGVIGAMEPVFQRNLESGLRELTNRVPSVFNSGAAIAGTDLTRQALQDFNLMGAQAAQQGINQQLQGLGTLGQLAGPAGMNPFQRALGAGQFGLAAQNQAFNQQTQPAMQLLSLALQQASPTARQTIGGPLTEGK